MESTSADPLGTRKRPELVAVSEYILANRLRTQRLVGEPFASVKEAVGWFGAVQSQDYTAAKWALGQRINGAVEADIDAAFDRGEILRTHVMRPTWHFVLPPDIVWIQQLTSHRVLSGLAARHRTLELDAKTVARATEVMGEALAGGNFLTRTELAKTLTAAGISVEGQRLPHIIASAEHRNVITSGPRRGKQFTYALLADRAPKARPKDREEALTELTLRYFRSHGPAQVIDFAWWSGLAVRDIKIGIDLAGHALEHEQVGGVDYYYMGESDKGVASRARPVAHLLPNFDEFTVAYRDRSALLDPGVTFNPKLFAYYRDSTPMGGILSNVVVVGGRVRGAWSRTATARAVRVNLRLLAPPSRQERAAIEAAVAAFGRFLGLPAEARSS